MFKSLSLRIKILSVSLVLAALLAGINYYQIYSIQHLSSLLRLVDTGFAQEIILNNVQLNGAQLVDQTSDYVHAIADEGLTVAQATKQADKVTITNNTLKQSAAQYKRLLTIDGSQAAVNQAASIAGIVDQMTNQAQAVIKATSAHSTQAAIEQLQSAVTSSQETLDTAVATPFHTDQQNITGDDTQLAATIGQLTDTAAGLSVGTIAITVIFGLFAAGWISRSLLRIKKGAQRIANGDMSELITINSHDELGQLGSAFNQMAIRLKDSYRRLAIERQRDEAILQNMGDGMIAIDEKQQIVLINLLACELLGIKQDTAKGLPLQDAYQLYRQSDSKNKDAKPISAQERPAGIALGTGKDAKDVFVFQRNDGNKYLLDIHASPIKLTDQIVGAVIILRDVTREKEVDRMKTEFISLASHQLRTPLSAIKWFTEMLISGDAGQLQPEQLDFAHNIADSTERMISLVNALLNISRIESGRIMVEPRPTDLKQLVTGIINDLKGKTEEKKQTLVVSVHSDLPPISLDPHLIGQVYLNLLTNAIKYTPKGGEISVFISKKDDRVVSQVTDNGYGIPKAQQGRVFEKFFRATNAVKVETDGTGLGLYLIKAVVESSGGDIWFESEEGKGTTFWFSIPLSGMEAKAGEVTLDA